MKTVDITLVLAFREKFPSGCIHAKVMTQDGKRFGRACLYAAPGDTLPIASIETEEYAVDSEKQTPTRDVLEATAITAALQLVGVTTDTPPAEAEGKPPATSTEKKAAKADAKPNAAEKTAAEKETAAPAEPVAVVEDDAAAKPAGEPAEPESPETPEEPVAEEDKPVTLEEALEMKCPIAKYKGRTLSEVANMEPSCIAWLANKFGGDERLKEGARLICEYAENNAAA